MLKKNSRRFGANSSVDSKNDSDIDITPMLDVVFIMLIFFIVTASFVKESGFGINTPAASKSQAPTEQPILLEIDSNNLIRIQNVAVSRSAIEATIVRLRAESPSSEVVVKVHPLARTDAMIAAVDSIRAAKVLLPSVSLSSS